MRVYRIQDQNGIGPYNSTLGIYDRSLGRMISSHCNPDTHPAYLIDFARYPVLGERSGCESMQALFKWFGGYLPTLLAVGYIVAVFEVPSWDVETGCSGKQVLFQSARAKRVDKPRKGA